MDTEMPSLPDRNSLSRNHAAVPAARAVRGQRARRRRCKSTQPARHESQRLAALQSRTASETHVQSEPDRTRSQGRYLIPSRHTEGIAESKGIRPYVTDIANIE